MLGVLWIFSICCLQMIVCVLACVCAHIQMAVPACALRPRKTPSDLFHYSLISLFSWDRVTPWTQNRSFWPGLLGSKFSRSGHLSVLTPIMQRLQACVTMLGFMCAFWSSTPGSHAYTTNVLAHQTCSPTSHILLGPWKKCICSLSGHYFPGVTGAGCHSQSIASIMHHHPNLFLSFFSSSCLWPCGFWGGFWILSIPFSI